MTQRSFTATQVKMSPGTDQKTYPPAFTHVSPAAANNLAVHVEALT